MVHTHGALNTPNIPTPTDEELLSRCYSHEDFDRFELSQDLNAIKRFLRWKAVVRSIPPLPMEGLEAHIVGRPKRLPPFYPRYELEPLPASTLKHIKESRRQSNSVFQAHMANKINPGITFNLYSELSPSEGMGICKDILLLGSYIIFDSDSR